MTTRNGRTTDGAHRGHRRGRHQDRRRRGRRGGERARDRPSGVACDQQHGYRHEHPRPGERAAGAHSIEAVGVGAAGFVDARRATVLFAPNLAWRDEPLKVDLERAIGLPVVIENDANAAAWGEFTFGAGEDVSDLLLVTVGTGVGGGIVVNGELHRGAFGVAAEIGHIRMVPGGRLCGCGNRGCWEQYASGTALVRDTREQAAEGSLIAKTCWIVPAAASRQSRDPSSRRLPRTATLSRSSSSPRSVSGWRGNRHSDGSARSRRRRDRRRCLRGGRPAAGPDPRPLQGQPHGRNYRPTLEIRQATLGNKAGMIGAADLARRP